MRFFASISILVFAAQLIPAENPQLPPHVDEVRSWLPTDTETLIVTRVPAKADKKTLAGLGRMLTMQPILKPLDGLVRDLPIDWAIHAGRNFRTASAFGTQVQEGISMIRYSESLSAELISQIHDVLSNAPDSKTTKIAGHEVHVFPISKSGREGYVKEEDWEGRFVLVLDDHTIIKASSDRYLKECLSRMKEGSTKLALPNDLPEWKYVDPDANVWLLRHLPKEKATFRLKGLVWMANEGAPYRVVYVPRKGASVLDIAQRIWIDQESKEIPQELLPLLNFAEDEDGVVTFTLGGKKAGLTEDEIKQAMERLQNSNQLGRLGAFAMFFPYTSQGLTQ